jgi:hypothetical protein
VAHEFSWSVSRHDTFNSCRRKYFYSYYLAPDDPEIHRLKKLSALPMWAGSVVHEIIEGLLKTRDTMPSETEQQAIVHAAVHERLLGDWRASEAGPASDEGVLRFRLFEHEYATTVDAEDKKIVVGTVMRSLRNFFKSPVLQEALAVGRSQWLTVEDLVSFEVGGRARLPAHGPRLPRRAGPRRHRGLEDGARRRPLQRDPARRLRALRCAPGLGHERGGDQTELAYLAIPRYVRRSVDARKLDHARAFIEKSAERMKGLLVDTALNLGRLEDFAMIDRPQACRRCNFRRLCFPPAAAVAVEAPQPSAAL